MTRKFIMFAMALALVLSGRAYATGLGPACKGGMLGPVDAKGVAVWSHGRSLNTEDSQAPTPAYMQVLCTAGWDVMRFNRLRDADTLSGSTIRLIGDARELKQRGYKQVLLAG